MLFKQIGKTIGPQKAHRSQKKRRTMRSITNFSRSLLCQMCILWLNHLLIFTSASSLISSENVGEIGREKAQKAQKLGRSLSSIGISWISLLRILRLFAATSASLLIVRIHCDNRIIPQNCSARHFNGKPAVAEPLRPISR